MPFSPGLEVKIQNASHHQFILTRKITYIICVKPFCQQSFFYHSSFEPSFEPSFVILGHMDSLAGHLEPGECEISSVSDVVCAGAGSDRAGGTVGTPHVPAVVGGDWRGPLFTSVCTVAVPGGTGLCRVNQRFAPGRAAGGVFGVNYLYTPNTLPFRSALDPDLLL